MPELRHRELPACYKDGEMTGTRPLANEEQPIVIIHVIQQLGSLVPLKIQANREPQPHKGVLRVYRHQFKV